MRKIKAIISLNHEHAWDLGNEKKYDGKREWEFIGNAFFKEKITQFLWDLGNDWDY